MTSSFDISMREDDFLLFKDGKPVETPGGKVVAHKNARLLRQAAMHEMMLTQDRVSQLDLLIKLIDAEDVNDDHSAEETKNDPLLSKQNYTDALAAAEPSLLENPELTDFIFINASSLSSALNRYIQDKAEGTLPEDIVVQHYTELTPEERVVLKTLSNTFQVGWMVHLLFLEKYLSVSEYSAGIILLSIKRNDQKIIHLFQEKGNEGLSEEYKLIGNSAINAIDFLALCKGKNQISVIEEIIQRGEDDQTEFKSTLRWDIRQSKKNPAIEHASLKTICAFLNTIGGDLLIGVRDDGSIEGFETDNFPNDDRFLLHLWSLIKSSMGEEMVEWVKTSLQKFGNKTVCRVHCERSTKPVFLHQKGFDEAFYIRTGPSSASLEIRAALKYIEQHF